MKRLTLVRHAKSSWSSPDLADFDRPLNGRGLQDAPFMADLFATTSPPPQKILTSPAKRALDTANTFAQRLGLPDTAIQHEPDIYEAPPQRIAAAIRQTPDDIDHLLVFGHNPGLHLLANQLLFKDEIDHLVTCGIIELQLLGDDWELADHDIAELLGYRYPKMFRSA